MWPPEETSVLTGPVWPARVFKHSRVSTSQTLTVPSYEPEKSLLSAVASALTASV